VRCCAVAVAASTTGEARLARRRVDPGSPGVDWATNLLHLFVFFWAEPIRSTLLFPGAVRV
jgi:hypothetical protein